MWEWGFSMSLIVLSFASVPTISLLEIPVSVVTFWMVLFGHIWSSIFGGWWQLLVVYLDDGVVTMGVWCGTLSRKKMSSLSMKMWVSSWLSWMALMASRFALSYALRMFCIQVVFMQCEGYCCDCSLLMSLQCFPLCGLWNFWKGIKSCLCTCIGSI